MLNRPFFKILSLYLIMAVFTLTLPAQGWAMLVPAGQDEARSADQAKVQATLESSVIKQRLLDFGLTPEETTARLNKLSDEQVHQLAANMDAVQAGGDSVLGLVLGLAIIALLVVLIIYLLEGRIVIKET